MDYVCFCVLVSSSKAVKFVLLKALQPKILIKYCEELPRFEGVLAKTR